MPIPDKPYTRREAYLNAAATGDSSGIPETPYTREEMYLDAIARGGGGGGGGGSSSTLSGLTDVDITNPTDGQTLVYNAESGKWENGAGAGGSGTLVVHQVTDGEDCRLDHTYAEISTAGYAVLWDTEDIGGGEYIVPVFPLVTLGYADPGGGSNPLYFVTFMLGEEQYQYTSRTQDGYPTLVK